MWEDVILYIAVGFAAQMIDGAIGMAYGVTATSVLLTAGVTPATASACVHAAEMFTTAASGLSHWRLGNVDRNLVVRLAIPGMIGGAIGAFVLTSIDGSIFVPWVSAYLVLLGVFILWKAWHHRPGIQGAPLGVMPLGFFGGMLDAIGGGGWGPMVTSTLLGHGNAARTTIGSVSLSEFFVTATISATFFATIGLSLWPIIAGLVIGGVIAAPLAALTTRHMPERILMTLVGVVVILLSTRNLLRSLAT